MPRERELLPERRQPESLAPLPADSRDADRHTLQDRRLIHVLLGLTAVAFLVLAVSRAAYPYDVGDYEANAWAPASLLAHFHNPYLEGLATHAPFVTAPYGPVYYATVGLGLRLFGDQFWFFRLVCAAAALLSAWLVFRIAYGFSRERFAAALGSALLLAQYPVLLWGGVQRPDLLALTLALAGLNLGLRRPDESVRGWYPILSALAFVAAALSRQTYVIPIAIVALWYLLQRDFRALSRLLSTALVVGAAIVATLSITSHGGLLANLVTRQAHASSGLSILTSHLQALAEAPITWVTALMVLATLAAMLRSPRSSGADGSVAFDSQPQRQLLAVLLVYFAAATAVALATASRAGSNINYLIEPLAVASLLIGVGGTRALRLTSHRRRVATVVVMCAGLGVMAIRQAHGELLRWRAKPYFSELVSNARNVPARAGPMFSVYPELVNDAGHVNYVNDFVQYDGRSTLLKVAFDRLIASRRLAAIVTSDPQAPAGYVRVRGRQSTPAGVYFAYLYVRRDIAPRSKMRPHPSEMPPTPRL